MKIVLRKKYFEAKIVLKTILIKFGIKSEDYKLISQTT